MADAAWAKHMGPGSWFSPPAGSAPPQPVRWRMARLSVAVARGLAAGIAALIGALIGAQIGALIATSTRGHPHD